MTDKEIIKAFNIVVECEGKDAVFANVNIKKEASCECKHIALTFGDILDLINRQQAEIERLTINMNAFGLGMKQEKERADTIRAEAVKEYKEKLKEHAYLDSGITGFQEMVVDLSDIENIAEEMVGEDK